MSPATNAGRLLRTLVVSPSGVVGGAERWLLALLDATERLRVESILLSDGPLRSTLADRGIPNSLLPTGRSAVAILWAAVRLAGRLRRDRPDVVLANGVKAAAVAIPACRLAGVPVVWVKHDFSFDGTLTRRLARAASAVIANSPQVAEGTGRPDVVVIPPPLPGDPATREAAREFWAGRGLEQGDHRTLMMATRLVPYKGVDDAIRALSRGSASGWRLVVVGVDDPAAPGERERLASIARRLGVEDRVRLMGPVEDAGRWFAAFDAVAVLTKTDERGRGREGFGSVALEASVAGVPLILARGGGIEDRLTDGAGIVVEPGAPEEVAAALESLSSGTDSSALRDAGNRMQAAHPGTDASAARLGSVLVESAGRPGAGLTGGPPASVVVTVLNEGRAIDGLLEVLLPQLGPDDELIVVDGGSEDDTAARVADRARGDQRLRLIAAPGANISRGRNVGIGAAVNDLIACTDAGCAPGADWLPRLRAAFLEDPAPALVTGIYRVKASTPFQKAMAVASYPDPREARRRGPLVRAYGRLLGLVHDPTMPTGRSMAFGREAWKAVGGFPERLETGEDVTFGRAIAASGRRCVLQADAEVSWEQRPSLRATARMYYRYGMGDALSGDRRLAARDLARLGAYLAAPPLAWYGGWPGRIVVAAGALFYLSLPLVRSFRRPRRLTSIPLIPVAMAVRDLSKAAGFLAGVSRRAHRPTRPSAGGQTGR